MVTPIVGHCPINASVALISSGGLVTPAPRTSVAGTASLKPAGRQLASYKTWQCVLLVYIGGRWAYLVHPSRWRLGMVAVAPS